MAGRKVSLQFGLLTVAAMSDTAVESTRTSMVNLCVGQPDHEAHDATPLTAPKQCVKCGVIGDYTVLKKGVKTGSSYSIVEQEEVAEAKDAYAKAYKGVLNLVPHPASQFLNDTAPGDSLHYLTPADAGGANHYQLLVKLVESHPELAFASLHTPVSATSLYMVRVRDGVLMMEKRVRSQSVKATPSVGGEVNDALFAQLEMMLPSFVSDYEADAYEDKYEVALAALLEQAETVQVGTEIATVTSIHTDDDLLAKLRVLNASIDKPKKPAKKKAAPKKKEAKAA